MRQEYKAITDAGLSVQLDDPIIVNVYEWQYSVSGDLTAFRKWAAAHVEIVNHALEGIPEDRVRYHLCWGSWKGPHSTDLPLRDVIDLVLNVKASQYSVEAANPQHEHEWKVWKDVKLPDGKAVVPGIVTHKTNVLEHREVVADRIIRYADVVGRENVIAGTDCGFGGRMHAQLAWAKLEALALGAALASKQLWLRSRPVRVRAAAADHDGPDRVRRHRARRLMPRKPGERVKTNRRDARKLAELGRAGLLTVVQPPTPADEAVRDLARARDDAREDLQRCRHRLGKLLLRRGLHYAGRIGRRRIVAGSTA